MEHEKEEVMITSELGPLRIVTHRGMCAMVLRTVDIKLYSEGDKRRKDIIRVRSHRRHMYYRPLFF